MRSFLRLARGVRRLAGGSLLLLVLLLTTSSRGQERQPNPSSQPPKAVQDMMKNPELLAEFGTLFDRMIREVRLPEPRTGSKLMLLLPANSVFYAGVSNYGEAAGQALQIFRAELQRSPALHQWWQSPDVAKDGPKFEQALEQYARISQYLGNEVAVAGTMDKPDPRGVLIAEIAKPGLKPVLEDAVRKLSDKAKPDVRVLEVKDLAGLPDKSDGNLLLLVRPDYLIASTDAATLRSFNARVESRARDFASTAFGQRITRAYQDGVTMVSAVDLQTILEQAQSESKKPQDTETLERTGFSDLKYMVWEHTRVSGQDVSESELSFNGPRHGIAAWLGSPAEIGGLDFASPKAVFALSLMLANPAQIYDDLRNLATATNPNAFAGITQTEQSMHISFRDDLLRLLSGEITIDVDSIAPPEPSIRAILRVNDAQRLQRTLNTLLTSLQMRTSEFQQDGTTFYTVRPSSAQAGTDAAYAFVDGYLVIASNRQGAIEAVRAHRSGNSLAKSANFRAALPPGHGSGVSAMLYEDPAVVGAMQLQRMMPELAGNVAQLMGKNKPLVMAAYGEENAIRGASNSMAMDAGVMMIGAAIAIPNLLRSRTAANEASAVGSLRTLNTAQVTYASTYPDRGFAMNLEALGGAGGPSSADHAGLIDNSLACAGGDWCVKSGYRFQVKAVCLQGQCAQYVAMATPVNASTGSRNFCSTSDGVIRFQVGPPLTSPISVPECRRWTPLP